MGGGGGFPFGAPISPWSGSSPVSHAGPCHPGLPPFAVVLVPVFSLSSSGALVCFVRGCFFLSLPLAARLFPWHVGLSSVPPPMSPRLLLAALAPFLGGWGRRGWGGGAASLSFLRRKHVASTAQARGAALVPLQGRGACRVAPVVALPTLRSLPRCPPRWGLHGVCFLRARSCGRSCTLPLLPPHLAALSSGGGAAVRPSLPSSPTLGGAEVCVGGGGGACRLPFVAHMSQARRKHSAGTRRGTRPSAGGGGHALWLPSSPFPPCARTSGGPPAGACTVRALFGHGRVGHPAPSYRCLPTLPRCPRGGGGRFSPPPLPASPALRGAGVGGGGRGAHVVSPSWHACRRHDAGTTQARGEALGCCGGGGGSLWAFPPFSIV